MLESRRSYGWGYVGSNEKGLEWLFTPDCQDPVYEIDPDTGRCCPHCLLRSGNVFKSEAAAIRAGRRWMKEAGRSGAVTAVKSEPLHFEY